MIVEQREIRPELYGRTLHVRPAFGDGVLPDIKKWFENCYTIQFAYYAVEDSYLSHGGMTVPCK